MNEVEIASRYHSTLAHLIDSLSHFLMDPWLTIFSHLISCYISTVDDKLYPQYKLIDYFFFGPVYAFVLLCLAPVGFSGIALWLLLCAHVKQEKFTYATVQSVLDKKGSKQYVSDTSKTNTFTFATANVLLAPEFVSRLNNVKFAYNRTFEIAKQILNHSGKPLYNVSTKSYEISGKLKSVVTELPCIDFLCLQEVWERSYALNLISQLQEEFSHFLYDVGEYSLKVNLCMIGSGLMFASKRPILAADFKAFTFRTKHAKYASQGVLCVKVLLYHDGPYRHVGFITNLHTQAFQEKEAVILSQLTEVCVFLGLFKKRHTNLTDIVDFDVICGDFNADNMSPADIDVQHHPLFLEYEDICVVKPGCDQDWAIGTELRQAMLYKPPLKDPDSFKDVLVDDSLRRLYLLDADVVIHGRNLVTKVVTPDADGHIPEVHYGGMRRVDKIIYSKSSPVEVLGYCFSTALTNLTDHLPVCLTLKTGVDD